MSSLDGIDLIKRQQAEIEELQKRIVFWKQDLNYNPKAERAEAIKKFAEKLKAGYDGFDERHEMIFYSNLMKAIDDVAKEMVGAENG